MNNHQINPPASLQATNLKMIPPTQGCRVQMAARVRPFLFNEAVEIAFNLFPESNQILMADDTHIFTLDHLFLPGAPQKKVYEESVAPLIEAFLEGENVSVVAMGPPGGGKSYSLFGPDISPARNEADFGLLPRALRQVFHTTSAAEGVVRKISVSHGYVLGASNELRDLADDIISSAESSSADSSLLDPQSPSDDRPLREIEVMTLGEAFGCVDAGVRLRQPGAHGIFSLRLDQMWETGGVLCSSSSVLRFLELSLPPPSSLPPDLALNALYSVIYAVLLQSQRSPPPATIPYADSPLTNLMKDGLGGNGRSLLLCCLSPSLTQFMQSLNSLQWVQQWGQIQNNPVANIRTEVERDTGVSGTLGTESCGTSGSLEEESKSGERIGKRRHNERRKKGRRRTPSDGEFQNSIFRLQFAASQYQGLISNAELVLQRILEGTRKTDGEEQPDGYLQGFPDADLALQIQNWFCLKEEAEVVLSRSDPLSEDGGAGSEDALSVIEEVTEPSTSSLSRALSPGGGVSGGVKPQEDSAMDSTSSSATSSSTSSSSEEDGNDDSADDDFSTDGDEEEKPQCESGRSSDDEAEEGGVDDVVFQAKQKMVLDGLAQATRDLVGWTLKEDVSQLSSLRRHAGSVCMKCSRNRGLPTSYSFRKQTCRKDVAVNTCALLAGFLQREQLQRLASDELERLNRTESRNLAEKTRVEKELETDAKVLEGMEENLAMKVLLNIEMELIKKLYSQKEETAKVLRALESTYSKAKAELVKAIGEGKETTDLEKRVEVAQQRLKETLLAADVSGRLCNEEKAIREMTSQMEAIRLRLGAVREKKVRIDRDCDRERKRKQELRIILSRVQKLDDLEQYPWSELDALERKLEVANQRLREVSEREAKKGLDLARVERALGNPPGEEEDELQREEIDTLRNVREDLILKRQTLDREASQSATVSFSEERRLVELDEAVEAVDRAIEIKNGILCSREDPFRSRDSKFPGADAEEGSLLSGLLRLAPSECKALLRSYFLKVVDLRTDFRGQEAHLLELENQLEEQSRYVQELSTALHAANIEKERRVILIQKEYEDRIASLLTQVNGVNHVSGACDREDDKGLLREEQRKIRVLERDLAHYRQSSKEYKRRLKELLDERRFHSREYEERVSSPKDTPGTGGVIPASRLLPLTEATPRRQISHTRVTREGNKLILTGGGSSAESGVGLSPKGLLGVPSGGRSRR